jgi:release factor glutamine methyltransferase
LKSFALQKISLAGFCFKIFKIVILLKSLKRDIMEKSKFLGYSILRGKAFRPRIETEFWVKKAIEENRQRKGKIKVLDLFSGSGCIGIAFLKSFEDSFVCFADISSRALFEIKKNLKINLIPKEKYRIVRSDFFSGLAKEKYDIIFANPPYVALDRIQEVEKDVLEKDPSLALFGGEDGTACIRKFLKRVNGYLKEKGVFYMEFDPLQAKEIKKILDKKKITFHLRKDQFGKIRWLKGRISKKK